MPWSMRWGLCGTDDPARKTPQRRDDPYFNEDFACET